MAIGDITRVIASLEWDTVKGYSPKIIHIAGNIYAIAYTGPDSDGWLKTVSISDDGSTLSNKGLLEWDTDHGESPDIIHIAGNIYAIAYTRSDSHGYLKTVSISDDGSTLSNKGLLEWDTVDGENPDIIHIADNIYAIAYYGGTDGGGWLKTVSISDDGSTLSNKGSLEWDTDYGDYPDIIHIAGNIYAIAYMGPGGGDWLKTVSISDNGSTLSNKGSLECAEYFENPKIINIAGNIYAIAYSYGLLKTVSISDNGLTLSNKASLVWDTEGGVYPDIIHIAGGVYAIAYTGSGGYGWLKTVSISDDGSTLSNKGSLEWDTDTGENPDIIHIAGNTYAIAYNGGPDYAGWLKTVGIKITAAALRYRFTGGVGGLQHRSIH